MAMLSDQVASFRSESVVLSALAHRRRGLLVFDSSPVWEHDSKRGGLPLIKVSKVSEPSFDLFFFFFRVDTEVPQLL